MLTKPFHQRGLGLVELMVGITVGLIVAAGASMVAVNQINEHRRLMLETQIQQDLRVAADLLQQDLRRAGYRGQTEQGVWAPPTGVGTLDETAGLPATANNYSPVEVTDNSTERSITYRYARRVGVTVGAASPRNAEQFGFKWDKATHVLYARVGIVNGRDNWQPVIDPDIVEVTNFDVELTEQSTDVGEFCAQACGAAPLPACPKHVVRQVSFSIEGKALHDRNVKRTVSGVERLRSDRITGSCPA
ncbi:PilW family protein [Roseateles sp. DXS20W]|uniref:PilW family protein n=1 Tax=Pelomonas lactea TaxID=3299030 RepID=A0ABW7GGT5_9BURK